MHTPNVPATVVGKFLREFKRELFSKSSLFRVSLLAFLFVSFFFAPGATKEKAGKKSDDVMDRVTLRQGGRI